MYLFTGFGNLYQSDKVRCQAVAVMILDENFNYVKTHVKCNSEVFRNSELAINKKAFYSAVTKAGKGDTIISDGALDFSGFPNHVRNKIKKDNIKVIHINKSLNPLTHKILHYYMENYLVSKFSNDFYKTLEVHEKDYIRTESYINSLIITKEHLKETLGIDFEPNFNTLLKSDFKDFLIFGTHLEFEDTPTEKNTNNNKNSLVTRLKKINAVLSNFNVTIKIPSNYKSLITKDRLFLTIDEQKLKKVYTNIYRKIVLKNFLPYPEFKKRIIVSDFSTKPTREMFLFAITEFIFKEHLNQHLEFSISGFKPVIGKKVRTKKEIYQLPLNRGNNGFNEKANSQKKPKKKTK